LAVTHRVKQPQADLASKGGRGVVGAEGGEGLRRLQCELQVFGQLARDVGEGGEVGLLDQRRRNPLGRAGLRQSIRAIESLRKER